MTITSSTNPIYIVVGETKHDISPYIDNLSGRHGKMEGKGVLGNYMRVEGFFPQILDSFFFKICEDTELEDFQIHYSVGDEYKKVLHINEFMGLVVPVK